MTPRGLGRSRAPAAAEVPARLPLSGGRALRVLEESDVDELYALIERLGFQYEGAARQAFRLADGYHDDAVYSMLATDWPETQAQR